MKNLEFAKETLLNNDYTCVICQGETVYTSTFRGVKPLVQWLDRKLDVKGFSAADKVIGRATAFLYVLLDVQEVYAHVMSRAAAEVLEMGGIVHAYCYANGRCGYGIIYEQDGQHKQSVSRSKRIYG